MQGDAGVEEVEATAAIDANNLVIVDSRDLRSALPFILHRQGFALDVATLACGDYLLSPEVAVERKSVADLIGSLQSGRLFTQMAALCAEYAYPMLLIEFDRERPFHLLVP